MGVTCQVAHLARRFWTGKRAVRRILSEAECPWDEFPPLFSSAFKLGSFFEYSTALIILLALIVFVLVYLYLLFKYLLERKIFLIRVLEKNETHFMFLDTRIYVSLTLFETVK